MVYQLSYKHAIFILIGVVGVPSAVIFTGSLGDITECQAMPGYDDDKDLRSKESQECLSRADAYAGLALPISGGGILAVYITIKVLDGLGRMKDD